MSFFIFNLEDFFTVLRGTWRFGHRNLTQCKTKNKRYFFVENDSEDYFSRETDLIQQNIQPSTHQVSLN
jgi:hypothetical protein